MIEKYTFSQLARRYCERQEQTPQELLEILREQELRFHPDGWMLLEAQLMDSSWFGSLMIMPYGGDATLKDVPGHPVSFRGLASDTSVVVAIYEAGNVPDTLPDDLKDWQAPPPPKKTRKRKAK